MVDIKPEVLVHGFDSHAILQVFGQKATVHHVEVKSVVQFKVHIAHQCGTHSLGLLK